MQLLACSPAIVHENNYQQKDTVGLITQCLSIDNSSLVECFISISSSIMFSKCKKCSDEGGSGNMNANMRDKSRYQSAVSVRWILRE
jgi:hypothetical protein